MINLEVCCVWFIINMADGSMMYLFSSIILNRKVTWSGWLGYLSILMVIEMVSMLLMNGGFSGWSLLLGLAELIGIAFMVFRYRGWELAIGVATMLCVNMTLALLSGGVSMLLLGVEQVNALMLDWRWPRLTIVAAHLPLMVLLLPVYQLRNWWRNRRAELPDGFYYMRALILLAAAVTCIVLLFNQLQNMALAQRLNQVALLFGVAAAVLAICLAHLAQDVRYLGMRKRHETLSRSKQLNDALVEDMRQFRGSMIAMVDGLGDVLLSGAPEAQRAYYDQMARQCARINHENVLTLQRLNEPALATLLLNKLERSRQYELPMYLHLTGAPVFSRRVPSSVLCQAVGVLVDNAIEAAADSEYPRVSIELAQIPRGVEINVLNTYPQELDVQRFLDGEALSTKGEGHGDGMASVAALCRRYPCMQLNRYARGRFIECSLTIR